MVRTLPDSSPVSYVTTFVVVSLMCFWGRCQVQTPQLKLVGNDPSYIKIAPADFAYEDAAIQVHHMDHFSCGLLVAVP